MISGEQTYPFEEWRLEAKTKQADWDLAEQTILQVLAENPGIYYDDLQKKVLYIDREYRLTDVLIWRVFSNLLGTRISYESGSGANLISKQTN